MELHGKSLIAGKPSEEGTQIFRAQDPSVGKDLEPPFYEATSSELDRAMALSENAFHDYRRLESEVKADFLDQVAEGILGLGEQLIERGHAETGLTVERLAGERGRTVNQLRMFGELIREGSWVDARIDQAIPDRKPLSKPDLRRMLIPIGPVAVFGASNFPLAFSVAGGDTASALAAGCPVVVKAHRSHPGTSELVGTAISQAVERAGLHPGVFSMLQGRGREVGTALVRHPVTRAVGFTGSQEGGRALFDAAAARPEPIPVYAEMGSLNPVFVLPKALEEAGEAFAAGLRQSVNLGVGQFCTNPGLVFAIKGRGMDRFLEHMGGLFSETPPATMLHSGIRDAYLAGVAKLESTPGVRLVGSSAGSPVSEKTESGAHVFTTDVGRFQEVDHLSEEVFGPATLVVSCGKKKDMEEVARNLEGHLTATIHGTEEDLARHKDLISILETRVGRLIFNGFPTGVEVCSSMHHGGPYPASSESRSTSVGTAAILRFVRPICYQDFPQNTLPPELQDINPKKIWRLVENALSREAISPQNKA